MGPEINFWSFEDTRSAKKPEISTKLKKMLAYRLARNSIGACPTAEIEFRGVPLLERRRERPPDNLLENDNLFPVEGRKRWRGGVRVRIVGEDFSVACI